MKFSINEYKVLINNPPLPLL